MSYRMMEAFKAIKATGTQRYVAYMLAYVHNDRTGRCDVSVGTLVRMTSLCERTVHSALKGLEKAGHLTRVFRTGRSTQYNLHPRTSAADATCGGNAPAAAASSLRISCTHPLQQAHPTSASPAPKLKGTDNRTDNEPLPSSGKDGGGVEDCLEVSPLATPGDPDVFHMSLPVVPGDRPCGRNTFTLTSPSPGLAAPPRQSRTASSQSQAPQDSRLSCFVRAYTAAWNEQHAACYAFKGGRDARALAELLQVCQTPVQELVEMARWTWAERSGDYTPRCIRAAATIHGFCENYNEIMAYAVTRQQRQQQHQAQHPTGGRA